jgi:hypothetical protein
MEARLDCEETALGDMKDVRDKMTACNEVTEKTEPDPEMMQSAVEHQEIPMGDAVVMPVRGLRKRRIARSWLWSTARFTWNIGSVRLLQFVCRDPLLGDD